MWFVDGEAIDEATLTEAAVRRSSTQRQHTTAVRAVQRDKQCVAVRCKAREIEVE